MYIYTHLCVNALYLVCLRTHNNESSMPIVDLLSILQIKQQPTEREYNTIV